MGILDLALPGTNGKKKIPVVWILGAAVCIVILILGLTISALLGGLDSANNKNAELQDKVDQLILELAEAEKIDVTYVGNRLETISELAVAEMTYNGIVHFTDGDIPFINKKEFYMAYSVHIKAGFDLSQADIVVTDHTVTITLPAAELYEPNVDETSIRFFDQSISLFNQESKQDLIDAITAAKKDVLAQPETEKMKETARTQVELLIKALFEGQIGDRDLILNIG